MRALVLFYSLDGNTRFIAENIAETLGADLQEIKTEKDLSDKGKLRKLIWGGRQVVWKKQPKIEDIDFNPDNYDVIVIGTPVWVGTFAPPLTTLFNKIKISGKKIACFYCHGGGPGKVEEKLKEALDGNEIINVIDFEEPLKKSKEENKIRAIDWAKTLLEKLN